MRLIDLFSGVGGFSLAARWMHWETIAFCERDEFCQKVLRKNFGQDIYIHDDIRTFSAESFRGRCDVVTAGLPCQPYSHAGKREGKADERFLFPAFFRVVAEIRPRWLVIENVRGLLSIHNGELFEEIAARLESEGYEVGAFCIPACAVNAPHRRDRLWIIAHADGFGECAGLGKVQKENGKIPERNNDAEFSNSNSSVTSNSNNIGRRSESQFQSSNEARSRAEFSGRDSIITDTDAKRQLQQKRFKQNIGRRIGNSDKSIIADSKSQRLEGQHEERTRCGQSEMPIRHSNRNVVADTDSFGLPGQGQLGQPMYSKPCGKRQINRTFDENQFKGNWLEIAAELCRENDGISAELDGTGRIPAKSKNKKAAGRQHRLRALGNAIVPQIALEIFRAIEQAEKEIV